MFVDRWNESLDLWENLNNISENTESKIELEIDSVKEKLNWLEVERFRWTPSHLEELLNKWYYLWIVVNRSLKPNNTYEYQKNSFIKLHNINLKNQDVRVYFDVERNKDWTINKLYIYSWKVKQEVSQESHINLFKHFSLNVNMYKNN